MKYDLLTALHTSMQEVGDNLLFNYQRNDTRIESFTGNDAITAYQKVTEYYEQMGLKKNDRIAIFSCPSPFYLFAYFGAIRYGLVPIFLDFNLSKQEITELCIFGEVKAILTTNTYVHLVDDIFWSQMPIVNITNGFELFPNSLKQPLDTLPETIPVDEEVQLILFSSGTTSSKKGVEISHQSMYLTIVETWYFGTAINRSGEKLLNVLPFSHVAGLISTLTSVYYHYSLLFVEDVTALKIKNAFITHNPTFTVLVPKIYETFMTKINDEISSKGTVVDKLFHSLLDFSYYCRNRYKINFGKYLFKPITKKAFGTEFRVLLCGGAPLQPSTLKYFYSLGFTMMNIYASTETNVNLISSSPDICEPEISGYSSASYNDIKLINQNEFGIGELVVKGPALFHGYYKDPETTKAAFTEDGYFKMGDLATVNEQGGFTIVGRQKEAILLPNGEKVSPDNVESFYAPYLDKLSYSICGVQLADNEFDSIHMFIEGNYPVEKQKEIEQLVHASSKNIPDNYRVFRVCFVPELPRTAIGKIKRFELKKYALEDMSFATKEVKEEERIDTSLSLLEQLHHIICNCSTVDIVPTDIDDSMILSKDLAFDSLSMFELCAKLEEHFHIDCSAHLSEKTTIFDLYQVLENPTKKAPKAVSGYKYDLNDYPLKKSAFDEKCHRKLEEFVHKKYDIEVIGLEKVPLSQPMLFCPNHQTMFDGMVITSVLPDELKSDVYCLAWDKWTSYWYGRYFMKLFQAIPLDRTGSGGISQTLNLTSQYIEKGKHFIIFPEGTRSFDGSMLEFKNGPAHIAKANNIPIVPVTINGFVDAYSKTKKFPSFKKNGHKIKLQIVFHEPVWGTDLETEEFTNQVKYSIATNINININN